MKVYLVYEGDEWLSNSSIILMGVFNTNNDAIKAIIEHGEIKKDNIKQITKELEEQCQCQCFDVSYIIKEVEIGEWDT